LDEISIVGKAANNRKFLIVKTADGQPDVPVEFSKESFLIEIDSDGTVEGTTIKVNGTTLEKMTDFSFSLWTPSGEVIGDDSSVHLSYTKEVSTDGDLTKTETYRLVKKGDNQMDKIIQLIKELLKTDKFEITVDDKSPEEVTKALETIQKEYADAMPPDLSTAIGILSGYASLGCQKEIVSKGTEINKVKAELAKLIKLVKEKKTGDDTDDSDPIKLLTKTVEALATKVEEIAKGKSTDDKSGDTDSEILKTIKGISERMEKLEKSTDGPSHIPEDFDDDQGNARKFGKSYEDDDGVFHWHSLLEADVKTD
jgi:hypothetical protein